MSRRNNLNRLRICREEAGRAVDALLGFLRSAAKQRKAQLLEHDDFLYLHISLRSFPSTSRLNPYRISLPHTLHPLDPSRTSLCLIAGDSLAEAARATAAAEKLPFDSVIPLSELRTDYVPFESRRRLCDSYDIFFAERRIITLLSRLIGNYFFKKKKIPLPVDISRPGWPEAVRQACRSSFLFFGSGTCIGMKVGRVSMGREEIIDNLMAAIEGAVKYVPKKWANIRCVYIKAVQSVALPIYQAIPEMAMKIDVGLGENAEPLDEVIAHGGLTGSGDLKKEAMKKERMWGVGLGLKLFLLVSMAAANILSLYHLSSLSRTPSPSSSPPPLQDLLDQLQAVRSTISRLTRSRPSPPPPELLLYSQISPIASSCSDHPDLLHPFMTYTPFSPCPASSLSIAESLLLRGCHPLPRRRCFDISPSSKPHISSPKPQISSRSVLDLPLAQLLAIAAASGASPIRLGLDIAGGDGALAADLKLAVGATVLTTTMDLGRPLSQAAAALRGVVPLHAPLQQRLPVHDGCLDLIRAGHAVNRWIPLPALEFLLFDADRLLRPGGLLWIDRFSCREGDLGAAYAPAIGRLGYRRIKWSVGNKTGTRRGGEVYLTALLQKPRPPPPVPAAGGRGGIGRD